MDEEEYWNNVMYKMTEEIEVSISKILHKYHKAYNKKFKVNISFKSYVRDVSEVIYLSDKHLGSVVDEIGRW